MIPQAAAEQAVVFKGRDLRLDFLRGWVMLVVICVHLEYLSFISMFMWERLGFVSSAEGFVSLSGIVLGIVYKKRLLHEGFRAAAVKLWRRAGQLYVVNVAVIASILLLRQLPAVNVFEVTHWVSPIPGGARYLLFPEEGVSWPVILKKTLLLEIGPHQFKVIGLYALLIAIAPIILYALHKGRTRWVVLLSWSVFAVNGWFRLRLSGAQFEYGFPLLCWQLLFFNGMVVGFHHRRVFDFLADNDNKRLFYGAIFFVLCFMVLALNNPEPLYWPWRTALYQDAAAYRHMYDTWFSKDHLGVGRVLNNAVLYITLFVFINRHWHSCYRLLGWLLIPIGQASLYVFIWHVYLIIAISNTSLPAYDNIWINTGIHVGSIALIWAMVKTRFLFAIVPR